MSSRSQVIDAVKRALGEEGFSPLAISASLARFAAESNFDPNAINRDDAGPGFHSRGLNQWNRDRLSNLKKFASRSGANWKDPYTQAKFYAAEVKGLIGREGKYGRKLLAAQTPEDAAKAAISLARPGGWTPKNPENGLGYKKTLKYTKQFAGGDFSVAKGSRVSDTGASTNSVSVSGNSNRNNGPSDLLNMVAQYTAKADATGESGTGHGWEADFQGPPIPDDMLDSGSDSSGKKNDSWWNGRTANILTGIVGSLGEGLAASVDGKKKTPKATMLEDEMRRGTNHSPSVAQIRSMIHV